MTESEVLQEMRSRITLVDTAPASFAGHLLGAVAFAAAEVLNRLEAAESLVFLEDAPEEQIEIRCAERGLYRKTGNRAKGQLIFTGEPGITVPAGTAAQSAGGRQFVTLETVQIDENGQATAPAASADEKDGSQGKFALLYYGAEYNLAADAVTTLATEVPGIKTVTNGAFTGGEDAETAESLRERYWFELKNPRMGGNRADLEAMAMGVAGVGKVKVYTAGENGVEPGNVLLSVLSTKYEPLSEEGIRQVQSTLEENAPVNMRITVRTPQALLINIGAAVRLGQEADLETVQVGFETAVQELFRNLAMQEEEISLARVGAALLNVAGVRDYSGLTLNGGTENVAVPEDAVALKGTVTLTLEEGV